MIIIKKIELQCEWEFGNIYIKCLIKKCNEINNISLRNNILASF